MPPGLQLYYHVSTQAAVAFHAARGSFAGQWRGVVSRLLELEWERA